MSKEERKVPELRFKGFHDDWEQRKLYEVAVVLDGDRGKNYPSSEEFSENGHTLFLSAANVTKNGFSFTNNQYITEDKSNSLGNGKLTTSDIVITSRGSIGHIAWYNSETSQETPHAQINSGMLILSIKENYVANYIAQYLKSPMGIKKIHFLSFGSAQPQLTKKDIQNYKIPITLQLEQKKISSLLNDIDKLITLHQRKINILNEQRKGYYFNLFPKKGLDTPKLRFKNYKEKWDIKELGDYVTFINGRAYKQEELLDQGKYRVLRVGNFNTNNIWYFSNLELEDRKYANYGDMLYLWATNFGPKIWNQEKVIYHYHIWKLDIDETQINTIYLYSWLEFDKERIKQSTNGTTMVHITKSNMEKRGFMLPTMDEQIKVGNIFKSIDNLISYQQKKLDSLHAMKKTYLNKLFI